jgi:hypothetical protein
VGCGVWWELCVGLLVVLFWFLAYFGYFDILWGDPKCDGRKPIFAGHIVCLAQGGHVGRKVLGWQ